MEDHDSRRHAAFWEAYRGCAEENRVPPDRSQYYVQWVKEFIEFLPGKRLKVRSGKDIEAFLVALGEREGVAQWKVRQAEHALKILYETFLPGYSPERPAPADPANVATTMIYTHVLNRPGLSEKSPADI